MSVYTIAIVTVLYALTAYDMAFTRRDYPMTIVWIGYTFANLGFLWSVSR
jgi:hypothetical protein